MKRLSHFLLLCSLGNYAAAQSAFESDLKNYNERIHRQISLLIASQHQLKNPNEISIQAVPYCIFEPQLNDNENLTKFSTSIDYSFEMAPDSARMTNELIYWRDTVFSIPIERFEGDSSFKSVEFPDWYSVKGIPDIPMIRTAQRYSRFCFYLRFLSREAEGNVPLAFLDQGTIHLIDRDLIVYGSVKEFIETKYGSIDKYLEMLQEDLYRGRLAKHLSVDDAKRIISTDFAFWAHYYPGDTSAIVNLFLNQMDSAIKLQPSQRDLLRYKIIQDLDHYLSCVCSSGIILLGRDITPLVKNVLTFDQYAKYSRALGDLRWLQHQAMDRLNHYYIQERKIPINKEDEVFAKEVFGPARATPKR